MNYNNVWHFAYGKRYYLTHPWKWIKEVGYNIRAAWQRMVRGWTYTDVWNMDTWFLHTIPPMLRYLAEHGCSYPGRPPFDGEYGPQRWKDWLLETADLLDSGREDWQEEHNQYYDEYIKHLMDDWEPPTKDENGFLVHQPREFTEHEKKYFARARELSEQGEKNVRIALGRIGEWFYSLWN